MGNIDENAYENRVKQKGKTRPGWNKEPGRVFVCCFIGLIFFYDNFFAFQRCLACFVNL